MRKQDGDTRKLLISELKRLFFTLRPTMPAPSEMLIQGYMDALDDLSAPEVHVMVREALRTKWDFVPPTPGELRLIVTRFRDHEAEKHYPVAEQMKHWTPSNPEWPEVREFLKKLREVSQ